MKNEDKQAIDEALKPCPFCGGEAGSINYGCSMTYVGCKDFDCAANDAYAYSVFNEEAGREAIKSWNTRAAPDVEAVGVDVGNYLEGLHSEIDMSVEDKMETEISVRESVIIGVALKILASRNLLRTPQEPIEGFGEEHGQ